MDFDMQVRNKDWNLTIMDILPWGYKPKRAYPWLEALFRELAEHKVWVMTSCADTPAMADLLGVMEHASRYGCPYAWHLGKAIPHRVGVDWLFLENQEADNKTSRDYAYYGQMVDSLPEAEEHFQGFKSSTALIVVDKTAADRISPDFPHTAGYGICFRFFSRLFKGQRPIATEKFETPLPPKQKKISLMLRLDQEWLDFCQTNGYPTTAVPFAGVGNKGSRMTEEEYMRWAVNCYQGLQRTNLPPEKYFVWAKTCKLLGDMDPDMRLGGPGYECITQDCVKKLLEDEVEVRKLWIEHLGVTEHPLVFHHLRHIIKYMLVIGSPRNVWTMSAERAMGSMVSQVHSPHRPDANLAILGQSDTARALAGLVQVGDEFLEKKTGAVKIPEKLDIFSQIIPYKRDGSERDILFPFKRDMDGISGDPVSLLSLWPVLSCTQQAHNGWQPTGFVARYVLAFR
eukprot:g39578.t1